MDKCPKCGNTELIPITKCGCGCGMTLFCSDVAGCGWDNGLNKGERA